METLSRPLSPPPSSITPRSPAMQRPKEDYTYLPLADARKSINQKVNLFAVVAEIGASQRSRGTDYFLKLKIVDQSYTAPGLSVNFFAENTANLPHVMSSGDIICLHNVYPSVHGGEVYCNFKKRISSFALYEGKCGSTLDPYQSSRDFRALEHSVEFIKKLRTWSLDYHVGTDTRSYSLQFKEIKVDLEIDLICKVLHVCEAGEDSWILYLWDGTDYPTLPVQTDLDIEIYQPIPLQLETLPLPRDVLNLFPQVGSILRLTAGKTFSEIHQLVGGNHWFKFRGIKFQSHSAMWQAALQSSSKLSVLSDEDESVLFRQRNYKERTMSYLLRRPFSCFPHPSCITETDYSDLADATLRESLAHHEVTHKCKCVVRVMAACPWQAKDFVSPLNKQYRVRLTLEDPTARIHAYICADDGVKFFGENQSTEDLDAKMSKLLGMPQEPVSENRRERNFGERDPPWVSVCLKSYCLDADQPWESRRYRIFATKLLN